jgi:hypothetical protein
MEEVLVESAPSQPDFTNESQNGQEAYPKEKDNSPKFIEIQTIGKDGEQTRPLVLTDDKVKFLQELMGSMVLHSGNQKLNNKIYEKGSS